MKKILLAVVLMGIASLASAQGLTAKWVVKNTLSGGTVSSTFNSACVDNSTSTVIVTSFGTNPTLHFFDTQTGAVKTSPGFLDVTLAGTPGTAGLAGFGADANGGAIYMSDNAASENLQKIDSLSDSSGVIVGASLLFPRNLSVEGSGVDTWVASTGTADDGPIQLLKASDAGATAFSVVGNIAGASLTPIGAAKAGCGISVPAAGQPPQYVAGSDIVGTVLRLRLFEFTGTLTDPDLGYTVKAEVVNTCVQAQIDLGGGVYEPVLINLESPADTVNNGAEIVMYTIDDSGLTEVDRVGMPLATTTVILSDRGSLDIDRNSKSVYAVYRSSASTGDACMARIDYSAPLLPQPSTGAKDWALYQ